MALLTSLGAPALAEPAPSVDEITALNARAARWLSRGNKAYRLGQLARAEEAYREAWALKPGFDVAGDLGMAELGQGKLREAAEHLAFSLRLFPLTGDPAARLQVQRAYERCLAGLAAVRVSVPVKGAAIFVDGVARGEAPLAERLFVEPGEHLFEARLTGYLGEVQTLVAAKGTLVDLALPLDPQPPPEDPLTRGAPDPEPAPSPEARRSLAPGVLLGGAAVASLGSGLILFGAAAGADSAAQTTRSQLVASDKTCAGPALPDPRCATLRDKIAQRAVLHDAGVGVTVLGVAAAAGATLYLLWPSAKPGPAATGLRAAPVFGSTSAGLVATGSF